MNNVQVRFNFVDMCMLVITFKFLVIIIHVSNVISNFLLIIEASSVSSSCRQ